MENLHKKYDINIYYEVIYSWESKEQQKLSSLNEICLEENEVMICFPFGIKNVSSYPQKYINNKGYFTEYDIINIILSYYNGNIGENELDDLKNVKPDLNCETRKDLLQKTKYLYFEGFILENNIYFIRLSK